MVIPWIGVPLSALLKQVEPTSQAKFVEFTTLLDSAQFPGQKPGFFGGGLDWPYVEGLRLDEALHPLTLLTVGMYGQVLPNQNGAPLRLVVPWKYGFKSAKSIVRIRLVEKEPVSSWTKANRQEYGFYSNVNPQVDHPRVHVGVEAILLPVGLGPGRHRLLLDQAYPDDGLGALEAVLPGNDQAQRRAVLVGQH